MAKKATSAAPKASGPDLLGMFGAASAGTASATKGKKDDTIWFTFKSKVRIRLASTLDSLAKTIAATKATLETEIKAAVIDEYVVPTGMALKACPKNCKVNDGGHIVGLQTNKRSVRSILSEDEVALCKTYKIPLKEEVKQEAALKINPEHLTQETLTALQKVLAQHPELPSDLIVAQQKEFGMVTTDQSLNAVFNQGFPVETIKKLLPVLCTQVITYGNSNVTEGDLAQVEDMLFPKAS